MFSAGQASHGSPQALPAPQQHSERSRLVSSTVVQSPSVVSPRGVRATLLKHVPFLISAMMIKKDEILILYMDIWTNDRKMNKKYSKK